MSATISFNHATLIQPGHPLHGKKVCFTYAQGCILEWSENPLNADTVIDANGALLSGGWFDLYSRLPDPGAEWKESLDSFSESAWYAGFTHAAVLAGVDPLPDKASHITSLLSRSKASPVKIWPYGAASEGLAGKEMAEAFELHQSGAVAQTDGITPHAQDALRTKVFEYCHSLDIPYVVHPYNPKWASGGQVHEGEVCVNLGLKGIPVIAETTALLADIEVAKWLQVPLRVLGITSKESIEIIRHARQQGVQIYVAVALMNLCFTEENIANFDERFKVLPVLRTEADRLALKQALLDGEIQGVFSNHSPEDIESQKVEFDYVDFGAATLSGFMAQLFRIFSEEELHVVLTRLSVGNREFLGVAQAEFKEGAVADFTLISSRAVSHTIPNPSIAYNQLPELEEQKGALLAVARGENIWINI
jgi:dihydroorotase